MNCATLALNNECSWRGRNVAPHEIQPFVNYRTLAERIADAMREHFGVRRRDRVALMMMCDRPEFAEVLIAISRAGAVAVPLNATLNRNELAHINGCSGARLMFAAPDFVEAAALVADAVPELDIVLVARSAEYHRLVASEGGSVEPIWRAADELAWIISGTTGGSEAAPADRNLSVMIYSDLCDIRIV